MSVPQLARSAAVSRRSTLISPIDGAHESAVRERRESAAERDVAGRQRDHAADRLDGQARERDAQADKLAQIGGSAPVSNGRDVVLRAEGDRRRATEEHTRATLAVYGAAPGTPAAAFTCSQSRVGQDEACLHVAGELDAATAPHLQRTLQAAQAATPHVVVDLRDVTFIGMAGVRTIVAAGGRARRAGSRLVVVSGTYAAGVFALTGSWDDVDFRGTDGSRADTPAAIAGTAQPARYRLPHPSLSRGR